MLDRRLLRGLLVITLMANTVAGAAQEGLPLPVFVTHLETPPLPPLRPEQHDANIQGARTEMFERAAQLRKEHGDKTSNWPPEVWKVFYQAEDAHTLAVARRDYQPSETRLGLADSVEDFVRGLGNNKQMTMVTTAEEASLVVQITGRRRGPAKDVTDNRYFIRFRIAPGAKLTTERFLELAYGHKFNNLWTKQLSHATGSSPYIDLEAGSPASFKNCAASVRAIVQNFIHERMNPAKKK